MKYKRQEILSIPNIMGYFRIGLIPFFCYYYLRANTREGYYLSIFIVGISMLTDFFDGRVARRFDMITELGKILDPIADKLTHIAITFCLASRYSFMWVLFGVMVIKEGYMGVMGVVQLKKGKKLNGAMWFGKVCTGCLYGVFFILLIFPTLSIGIVNVLIGITIVVTVLTFFLYMYTFKKLFSTKLE